jgi:hypothetical protein
MFDDNILWGVCRNQINLLIPENQFFVIDVKKIHLPHRQRDMDCTG